MRTEHAVPPAAPRPIVRIGLAGAPAALVLAACGSPATGQERGATDRQAAPPGPREVADQSEATPSKGKVGPVRAIRIATAAADGGRVFDMELDRERGRLRWELDVASSGGEYDVTINARSGKVARLARDRTPDRSMRLLEVAKLRAAKAARAATAAVSGANLRALELDRWRTSVVWEAELATADGTEHDVKVDARTGKVVSKRIDD